jgi:thiol-disulfide isomerase/thioredoxin
MNKLITTFAIALMLGLTISKAQTTAMQFSGTSCNGSTVDLFADLDAGKLVVLHFYMPSCGSCPPPAQKIKAMATNVNAHHPDMVKGYVFPFNNTTTCTAAASWVTNNGLSSIYTAMDSGATHVAHYGGFGMPTVVLLGGGTAHRVLFSTLNFNTSDTTIMRDSIMAQINAMTASIKDLPTTVSAFNVFPNPATDNVSITVDLKETSNISIEIVDLNGKLVAAILNEKANGNIKKEFNVSSIANGNYLVRLQSNGKATTQKLSVNH